MNVNDDRLSQPEQAEMRELITGGAKRMTARRARRQRVAAAVIAVVLVGGVTAGVSAAVLSPRPEVASTPTPTPTVTRATPTPTPTPTATIDPAGVQAFGGECTNALTEDEVSAAIGKPMRYVPLPWPDPAKGLQGGAVCSWFTAEEYAGAVVTVTTYPASAVSADLIADPRVNGCDDMNRCGVGAIVDGTWLYLTVAFDQSGEIAASLWDLAAARVVAYPAPEAAVPTTDWWQSPSCDALVQAGDFTASLGGEAQIVSPGEVPDDPTYRSLPLPAGDEISCDLRGPSGVLGYVVVIPGGGAYFPQLAASDRAVAVVVEGAAGAAEVRSSDLLEGYYPPLAATDGANLILVMREQNAFDVPLLDKARFAADVLAALN